MLLILVIVLIAVQTKHPYVIVISALILHIFCAWISSFAISGLDVDIVPKSIFSILIGIVLHKWLERNNKIHGSGFKLLLKRQITRSVALLLLTLGTISIWNVFLAIENARVLVLETKARMVVHSTYQSFPNEPEMADTQEMTGFGILPDTSIINPESGQLTNQARVAKMEEIARQRANGKWTLFDAALTASNTAYITAYSLALDFAFSPDPDFEVKNVPGLFEGIPPRFHLSLAMSGSSTEAWARKALIIKYLKNAERLAYSGTRGLLASYLVTLVDF
ncbi:MAG: hypothetical protein IPH06_03650 [Alphaproteobacteria bacterium]|nr:hypothetical protein [Alphaproteobacteria bacterium]QQS57139.1 MAG: hypothetical protein IPN28_12960 [Alphaproteobacteria bacterium]